MPSHVFNATSMEHSTENYLSRIVNPGSNKAIKSDAAETMNYELLAHAVKYWHKYDQNLKTLPSYSQT